MAPVIVVLAFRSTMPHAPLAVVTADRAFDASDEVLVVIEGVDGLGSPVSPDARRARMVQASAASQSARPIATDEPALVPPVVRAATPVPVTPTVAPATAPAAPTPVIPTALGAAATVVVPAAAPSPVLSPTAVPAPPTAVPLPTAPPPPPAAPSAPSAPSANRPGPAAIVNQLPASVFSWMDAYGWKVQWLQGPGPGRIAEAQYATSTIVIWYTPDRSDAIWAGAFAHELGHAVSYVHFSDGLMNDWNALRGMPSWRWVPGTPNDFSVGEGDFAEAFMSYLLGHPVRSAGGPLSAEDRAWIAANTPF